MYSYFSTNEHEGKENVHLSLFSLAAGDIDRHSILRSAKVHRYFSSSCRRSVS